MGHALGGSAVDCCLASASLLWAAGPLPWGGGAGSMPWNKEACWHSWRQSPASGAMRVRPGGGLGKGESWNGKVWHNKNVPNVAVVFLRPEAIVLGVTVRALGMRIPFVPAEFPLQGPFGRAAGGYCGLPLVVVHDGSSIVPKSMQHHPLCGAVLRGWSVARSRKRHASGGLRETIAGAWEPRKKIWRRQPTKGQQETTTAIRGLCLFLSHNPGTLYRMSQRYLRIGGKCSPHQISPFQMSHVPNPTPPPPGYQSALVFGAD